MLGLLDYSTPFVFTGVKLIKSMFINLLSLCTIDTGILHSLLQFHNVTGDIFMNLQNSLSVIQFLTQNIVIRGSISFMSYLITTHLPNHILLYVII